MKYVIPGVMAGVISIYALIVGVIVGQSIVQPNTDCENAYSTYSGMATCVPACVAPYFRIGCLTMYRDCGRLWHSPGGYRGE